MSRVLVLLIAVGILLFGVLIGAVLLIGRVLPAKQLVYVSAQIYSSDLVLLDLYHRIHVKVFPVATTPSWSPDGERIAFRGGLDDMPHDLYILDVFSHHLQQLTNNGADNESPSWSPDGHEIVFASDYDKTFGIFVISVNCKGGFEHCATRLTPKDINSYSQPAWSPDRKYIVLVATKDTNSAAGNSSGTSDIYIMNRDGNNLRRLTKKSGYYNNPSWSPNSQQIVYAAEGIQANTMSIMIMDIDCPTEINYEHLVLDDNVDLMPQWSPDGSSIVFVDFRNGSLEIYLTDTEGHYLQRLTYNDVNEFTPRWRP